MRKLLLASAFTALGPCMAQADTLLWISDTGENIGQVNITTQQVQANTVRNTGVSLTDIAFNSAGAMFGTTFTGLYTLDPSTGSAGFVGSYANTSGMNALVGFQGNLLGASFSTQGVFNINATNANTSLFAPSANLDSAGDLAFLAGVLYASDTGPQGADVLVDVSTDTIVGAFTVGLGGPTLVNVFGLASDGTNVYAVAGTTVYSVDVATAVLTPLFDYALAENDQNLGAATGSAFIGESPPPPNVPEPFSLALLGSGMLGLGIARRRRASTNKE